MSGQMKLVVGLGNPGSEYENTRHNVGFRVIGELARRWSIDVRRRKFDGLAGDGCIRDEKTLLLKPMTYMNRSGRCVRQAVTFHKLPIEDALVVTDDMALPLGRLRIRPRGTAGGHNGLIDIIEELGTSEFARLRMGIGAVAGERMVGHVLGPFNAEERDVIDRAVARAADAVECWIADGVDEAMNTFNRGDTTEET
jgi:PTH1 family peptidyl-tRNA hydrolase